MMHGPTNIKYVKRFDVILNIISS